MPTDSKVVTEKLLLVGAVQLNLESPYTWASGWKSPVYCDNRKMLSYPAVRDFIKEALSTLITESFSGIDAIAGVATAGIAWGALVADKLHLPFAYVRPAPKAHGLGNQIEGKLDPNQKVVVVEDLVSTGKSSLAICEALIREEVEVVGLVSIFNYGFRQAAHAFNEAGVVYKSLADYEALINLSLERGIVSPGQLNSLLNWRANPAEWNS